VNDPVNDYTAYRNWAEVPLDGPPRISVVVPAYNEAWRILPTVGAVAHHMSRRGEPWELVVADDGSTDETVALLRGTGFVNLRVLVAERNGGKGSAVRRGMQAARGEYLLFADADQSTPIEQFDRLLAELRAGHDVVIGSRAASGAAVRGKSLLRRAASRGLRTAVSVGTGLRLADTQCGFKLFTAGAARRLFGTQVVDGFAFDLEVLYLARKLGLRVAEVPVEWIDAPGSTVDTAKVSLQFLRELLRIRLRDLRGGYDRPAPQPETVAELVPTPEPRTEPLTPAPTPDGDR
jgi:dolichyl-phosphate beta-glucosyltransferase